MRKKLLLTAFAVLFAVSAAALTVSAASGGAVIAGFAYSRDDFSNDFTETTSGAMPTKLRFNGDGSQSVGVIGKTELTGAYTAEFSVFSSTDGFHDFFFVLGNPSAVSAGGSVLTSDCLAIGRTAGALLVLGTSGDSAKFYEADGITEAAGNFVMAALGVYPVERETLYRFDVQADGTVNVYYDFAETENALTTLRNVIKGVPEGATDGYLAVIPHVNPAESAAGRERDLYYMATNGVKDDCASLDTFTVSGDSTRVEVAKDFRFTDAQSDVVASNFRFTDEGLEADDTVFDIRFVASAQKWAAVGAKWGVLFGMKSQTDTAATNGVGALVMEYASTSFTRGDGTAAQAVAKSGGTGENATPAYLYNSDCRVRLVGKKGGTLEFYRQAVGEDIETLHSSYTGFDFNGGIAFYSAGAGDARPSDYTQYKEVEIAGNVAYEVKSVAINRAPFANAEEGSVIDLSAVVTTYPQTTSGVAFSIVRGGGAAELVENGTKLKITASEAITVRATSLADESKYDEYTFTPQKLVFERYRLKDGFTELNECDWTLSDGDGNVTFNEGVYVEKDFRSDEHGSAKLISNVKFVTDPAEDTVFDITFKSELLASGKYRDPAYSWGLLFGMPDQAAALGDAGVGYFKVDYISTSVYYGGVKIEPSYKTERQSENCDVYCENPLGYTVRLVGHKNGTLDVYRGYSSYEKLGDLFATYSGFDFNGYVAFTTDSARPAEGSDYAVRFVDVSLEGNVVVDGNYEVKSVTIDKTVFRDAIVSDAPLTCAAVVNALPNLTTYRGVVFTLLSGDATLSGDSLTITGPGKIKLRATSVKDETKYDEYEFEAIRFTVTEIVVDTSVFEGVDSDSQPLPLVCRLECNSLANRYQSVTWTVLSGPAEVAGSQLRITGVGEVRLKVTSVYAPESSREFTFTVADADAGSNRVDGNGNVTGPAMGLSAGAVAGIVVGCVGGAGVLAAGAAIWVKKRKKHE